MAPVGAIVPASIGAAAIGVLVNAAIVIFTLPTDEFSGASPAELLLMIGAAGFALALVAVGASFVIAFYLTIFGLPVAWLLGNRIAHPLALGLALIDATIAAAFAVARSSFLSSEASTFSWIAFLMVGAFAIPAGFLYRRQVIIAREEAELSA